MFSQAQSKIHPQGQHDHNVSSETTAAACAGWALQYNPQQLCCKLTLRRTEEVSHLQN